MDKNNPYFICLLAMEDQLESGRFLDALSSTVSNLATLPEGV